MRTGLLYLMRHLDDGGELRVLLVLEADIAGIDAVFVERLGAGRMVGQQLVADVVEVADQRHGMPSCAEPSLMCGTAAAASSRSTVMRTSSEPARASAATCAWSHRHRPCRYWSSTARRSAHRRRPSRRRHPPLPICDAQSMPFTIAPGSELPTQYSTPDAPQRHTYSCASASVKLPSLMTMSLINPKTDARIRRWIRQIS